MNDILHGDCRELLPEIVRSVSRPIIVTDPPFNVGYHYDEYADRMDEGEYYEMLLFDAAATTTNADNENGNETEYGK